MKLPGTDPRRLVPRTDVVLADPRLAAASAALGAAVIKDAVRWAQDRARRGEIAPDTVADAAYTALPAGAASMRPIVNATGVVLHTNLGRAPLSAVAVAAVTAAAGYVDLEYDVDAGTRARRGRAALAALRAAVPRAEDVHVVNNGAAALVLVATALAAGKEIVISRSELVEIGDGFRLPDLLCSTGARLREVGTTNRTHLADYAEAIGPDTGFILKVHPSNFRIEGFYAAVPVDRLATLGAPVVADIGSGLLTADPLLPEEPVAAEWLRQGADVVTASGDKLLGGPQAGLILGRRELVDRLRRHPLARALRTDKMTMAALEASVRGPATPTAAALHADPEVLRTRADGLAAALRAAGVPADVVPSAGAVGGGAAPGLELPGWAVGLPSRFAESLRRGSPSVVGRVDRGRCLLDLRCVPPGEDEVVRRAVVVAASTARAPDPPCTS
jgi:L-seryl-tRNA(Ser) seleniumtransferase